MPKTEMQKTLPPADYLLYSKLENLVKENTNNLSEYEMKLLVHKLLYIIAGLILKYYGQPVFDATFIPMDNGPVEKKIYKIQDYGENISTSQTISRRKIEDDDMRIYTSIVDDFFNAVSNAIHSGIFELNPERLSDTTHTDEWTKKNTIWNELEGSNRQFNIELVNKDILKFVNTKFKDNYKDFIDYVEDYLDDL